MFVYIFVFNLIHYQEKKKQLVKHCSVMEINLSFLCDGGSFLCIISTKILIV